MLNRPIMPKIDMSMVELLTDQSQLLIY